MTDVKIEKSGIIADWICIAGGFFATVILSVITVCGIDLPLPTLPIAVIFIALIGSTASGGSTRELLHLSRNSEPERPLKSLLYFLLMFISMLAANFLTQFISQLQHTELDPQILVEDANSGSWFDFIEIAVTAIIFAPIAEELYFRGALFRRLDAVLPSPLSMGITAIFFAAAHANIQTTASLLIMSVFLSWEYLRTNSVRNCILLHAGNNLITIIQILFMRLSA